jgi:heptaprenyl diphosphate synthase
MLQNDKIKSKYNKIALAGIFGTISVVLGVIENFLPMPITGVRLGLANLPVIVMLYIGGIIPALTVMTLKMTLVPLLSGNLIFRLSLSMPASVMAFIAMSFCVLFLRRYFSPITTGILGAVLHMITQLCVINWLYIRGILYTPIVGWLIIAALCTGILTGGFATILINRLRSVFGFSNLGKTNVQI